MTLIILAIMATMSVGYDLYLTIKRIRRYSLEVELNPLTKLAGRHLGVQGIVAAILLPHLAMSALFLVNDWVVGYAFYTGYLANHTVMQLASLAYEREIRAKMSDTPPTRGL